MKVALSLLICFLSANCLDAQKSREEFKACYYCREGDIDTLPQYEMVKEENNGVIAFRKYQPKQQVVAEEYLHVDKDTFLFIRYSPEDHHIMTKGKVVPTLCCVDKADTTIRFDPITFDETHVITHYLDWSKEGYWRMENDSLVEGGTYKNNCRVGEWSSWNKMIRDQMFSFFDNEGKWLYNEPRNLLQTKNLDRIRKAILGKWRFSNTNFDKLEFDKRQDGSPLGYVFFTADSVKIHPQPHCGGLDKRKFCGTWTIDNDNIIRIMFESGDLWVYKITSISRFEMEWEIVK